MVLPCRYALYAGSRGGMNAPFSKAEGLMGRGSWSWKVGSCCSDVSREGCASWLSDSVGPWLFGTAKRTKREEMDWVRESRSSAMVMERWTSSTTQSRRAWEVFWRRSMDDVTSS